MIDADTLRALRMPEDLVENLRDGANLGELARRQFREIARVAGLLPPSLPGRALRSLRQLQAALARCHAARIDLRAPKTLTPLSFPRWAEGMRGSHGSEDWRTRVQRAAERLEKRHG